MQSRRPANSPVIMHHRSGCGSMRMVRTTTFAWVADWLNNYVVKQHADKEALREKWLAAKEKDRWAVRAGWHLTAERVVKSPEGLDVAALLDRIEAAVVVVLHASDRVAEPLGRVAVAHVRRLHQPIGQIFCDDCL